VTVCVGDGVPVAIAVSVGDKVGETVAVIVAVTVAVTLAVAVRVTVVVTVLVTVTVVVSVGVTVGVTVPVPVAVTVVVPVAETVGVGVPVPKNGGTVVVPPGAVGVLAGTAVAEAACAGNVGKPSAPADAGCRVGVAGWVALTRGVSCAAAGSSARIFCTSGVGKTPRRDALVGVAPPFAITMAVCVAPADAVF
jgi:hypothetical protein